MLSSNNEFDTHHIWNVVIWIIESSLVFPSNLGISVGIFTGTIDQVGLYCMGLFVSLDRLGSSSVDKKGSFVLENRF